MKVARIQPVKFAVVISVLLILFAVGETASSASSASNKILIDVSHGQVGRTRQTGALAAFEGNLSSWGYEWVEASKIDADTLADATFLFLDPVFRSQFTSAEISAIKEWFSKGGRVIWVGSDSDFQGGGYIADNANQVLAALGSKLRSEPTQVLDDKSNAGENYRVVANQVNHEAAIAGVTQGVDSLLFHGPTLLAGVVDGNWVSLETTSPPGVYWLVKTSADSRIADDDNTPPKAHKNGDRGSFVVMALETVQLSGGTGIILVSGTGAYGSYEPLFLSSYLGVDLQGPEFVKNVLGWSFAQLTPATTTIPTQPVTQPTPAPTTAIVATTPRTGTTPLVSQQQPVALPLPELAIVIVIVIGVLAFLLIRRRKPK